MFKTGRGAFSDNHTVIKKRYFRIVFSLANFVVSKYFIPVSLSFTCYIPESCFNAFISSYFARKLWKQCSNLLKRGNVCGKFYIQQKLNLYKLIQGNLWQLLSNTVWTLGRCSLLEWSHTASVTLRSGSGEAHPWMILCVFLSRCAFTAMPVCLDHCQAEKLIYCQSDAFQIVWLMVTPLSEMQPKS